MSQTLNASSTRPGEFVAYEYLSVRAPRELESLFRDTYANFGWTVEEHTSSVAAGASVTLTLKRDRRIAHRSMVLELQRRAVGALDQIAQLERSVHSASLGSAIVTGVVGSAFLAGSVFTLEAGAMVVSIVLGAVGLLVWSIGGLAFGRVRSERALTIAPLVDRQYDIVYETAEQAARLLAG